MSEEKNMVKHPQVIAFEERTGRQAIDQYGGDPDMIEEGSKHQPLTSAACTLRGVRKVVLHEGKVVK